MQRLAAFVLCIVFTALGSGLLLHVHNEAHAAEDAAGSSPDAAHHDSSNCDLHGALNLPVLSGGFIPVLIALGLFVAFISQLTPTWVSAFAFRRLDCRGPPAC